MTITRKIKNLATETPYEWELETVNCAPALAFRTPDGAISIDIKDNYAWVEEDLQELIGFIQTVIRES